MLKPYTHKYNSNYSGSPTVSGHLDGLAVAFQQQSPNTDNILLQTE